MVAGLTREMWAYPLAGLAGGLLLGRLLGRHRAQQWWPVAVAAVAGVGLWIWLASLRRAAPYRDPVQLLVSDICFWSGLVLGLAGLVAAWGWGRGERKGGRR